MITLSRYSKAGSDELSLKLKTVLATFQEQFNEKIKSGDDFLSERLDEKNRHMDQKINEVMEQCKERITVLKESMSSKHESSEEQLKKLANEVLQTKKDLGAKISEYSTETQACLDAQKVTFTEVVDEQTVFVNKRAGEAVEQCEKHCAELQRELERKGKDLHLLVLEQGGSQSGGFFF